MSVLESTEAERWLFEGRRERGDAQRRIDEMARFLATARTIDPTQRQLIEETMDLLRCENENIAAIEKTLVLSMSGKIDDATLRERLEALRAETILLRGQMEDVGARALAGAPKSR